MKLSHDDYDWMYGASDGPGKVGQWIQRHPTEVVICVVLSILLALFAGHAIGDEAGYERGSYEQWHEADTWAEQTHAACMEQARTKPNE